jgi:hypothetical protein
MKTEGWANVWTEEKVTAGSRISQNDEFCILWYLSEFLKQSSEAWNRWGRLCPCERWGRRVLVQLCRDFWKQGNSKENKCGRGHNSYYIYNIYKETLRQELRIYACPPDHDTNRKVRILYSIFKNECGSVEDTLRADYSSVHQLIEPAPPSHLLKSSDLLQLRKFYLNMHLKYANITEYIN